MIYDIQHYKITNENVKLLRLPVPDIYTKDTINGGLLTNTRNTESKSKILGTIWQYYSGRLLENGLQVADMFWSVPLVAQDMDNDYILLQQTPALGYGSSTLLIDEKHEYIYFFVEKNAKPSSIIRGEVSKEVGEKLFDMYREGTVTDIHLDKNAMGKIAEMAQEMKLRDASVAPTANIKKPPLIGT